MFTIGKIKEQPMVIDGKIEPIKVCDFGITLDERVADGFYFAKSLNILEHIFNNPNLLEDRANDKIILDKDK